MMAVVWESIQSFLMWEITIPIHRDFVVLAKGILCAVGGLTVGWMDGWICHQPNRIIQWCTCDKLSSVLCRYSVPLLSYSFTHIVLFAQKLYTPLGIRLHFSCRGDLVPRRLETLMLVIRWFKTLLGVWPHTLMVYRGESHGKARWGTRVTGESLLIRFLALVCPVRVIFWKYQRRDHWSFWSSIFLINCALNTTCHCVFVYWIYYCYFLFVVLIHGFDIAGWLHGGTLLDWCESHIYYV